MQQIDCTVLSSCHVSLPIPAASDLSPSPYHDQFALPRHMLVTARLRLTQRCARPTAPTMLNGRTA
jgi:hypothetical protein